MSCFITWLATLNVSPVFEASEIFEFEIYSKLQKHLGSFTEFRSNGSDTNFQLFMFPAFTTLQHPPRLFVQAQQLGKGDGMWTEPRHSLPVEYIVSVLLKYRSFRIKISKGSNVGRMGGVNCWFLNSHCNQVCFETFRCSSLKRAFTGRPLHDRWHHSHLQQCAPEGRALGR